MSVRRKVLVACLILVSGGMMIYKASAAPQERVVTIGIVQTASHPALDQARESFVKELTHLMEGQVRFVVHNAEGSLAAAQTIANNFHVRDTIDAIYAIATPAVQAVAKIEKKKPIFIAAVSDPDSLGVVHATSNVCGTTDRIDTDAQADLIVDLVPHVKTVAILYNPGESNSVVTVRRMEQSLRQKGLDYLVFGVHTESEIGPTVHAAARRAEAILVPTDNLLVGAMPLVAKEAVRNHCPLFASDLPSATKGAFAVRGADYGDLGKVTAGIAYEVLVKGQSPVHAGIVHPDNSKIYIHKNSMEQLTLTVPDDLIQNREVTFVLKNFSRSYVGHNSSHAV